ncbi:cobalt-zinc-cadmium efflux system protein [Balnearium lithotrophicum]|uniref:Cobalt-zinc-cadmium efflux system protein n=1 Tax=Balnearium lithotrophicum TaxID=223788 RepID=A0A521AYA8_9BACT|nr:cation diffusion facilitator family transporter [Balnearium lithotrophicum]SMO39827.1 cobalt-zinc-cadmium efflux system protein [Balnearium lithotrophicum]
MGHHHHHSLEGRALLTAVILNVVITLTQIVGGIWSGSLALLSDAVHNLSDVLSLVIAWWANRISKKPRTEEKTFGYKRAETIAALFNSTFLFGIAVFLIVESLDRLIHPQSVTADLVIWLGVLSILLNGLSVFLLKEHEHENLNIRAAYLHLLTDVMTSFAVVLGGILIKYFHVLWIDSLVSILIAVYLMKSSYPLIRESIDILMQGAPPNINIEDIKRSIESKFNEVENLHHIHLWRLDEKTVHFEAHVDFDEDLNLSKATETIGEIEKFLKEKFGINHVTLQPEFNRRDRKELIYRED